MRGSQCQQSPGMQKTVHVQKTVLAVQKTVHAAGYCKLVFVFKLF